MTFSVYAPDTPLARALVIEFSKIAKTALATTTPQLQAQDAANILILSPFHDSSFPHQGKKILHIVQFENTIKDPKPGTYYVEERSEVESAAKEIVKRFLGFQSSVPCVIAPEEYNPMLDVPFIAVPRDEHREVITIPEPKKEEPRKVVSVVAVTPARVHHVSKRRLPKNPKGVFLVSIVLGVWLLSLPFVLLLVSGVCGFAAVKAFPSRKSVFTTPLLTCSHASATASTSLTQFIPQLTAHKIASFVSEGTTIALEMHALYVSVPTLTPESLKALSPQLFNLSREVSALSSRTTELSQIGALSQPLPLIFSHAPLLQVLATVSSQADDVLGKSSPKTYMVLLQNNMELRPTGGFIGSFILLDVDNASVTSQKLYDVYDADGQMSGYVKPPEAIVNYLGEASWHLRDSNWDPDFAISAKRAEWFLDKSLNRQVDGVIGVDLEVLRTIIKSLGSITVPDYGGELTADNFYATIQTEVHKEFFPGSRKKSNYLTAVFNAVLLKLNKEGTGHAMSLLTGFLGNIDSRDIQFYMNNTAVETELTKAGVAGEVSVNSLGFVEANVGVNKANQYIERSAKWDFQRGESQTQVQGSYELTNTASEKSDETRYRVYLRTFAPKGSTLTNLKVTVGGVSQAIVPEKESLDTREQEGAFFELKAGEQATVVISWLCPPSTDITLWKQAGVAGYPIWVSVLTDGTKRQYNTTFAQDQHIQL